MAPDEREEQQDRIQARSGQPFTGHVGSNASVTLEPR